MPDVQLVSTLELMRLWASEALVPQSELRDAMTAMRSAARLCAWKKRSAIRVVAVLVES